MEQKEFEKRCISLNEEYMQKKVEIEKRLASLKKTRAEIRARMAQQELEYKELGILAQEQEAQLRNLNLQYHHERNVLKMQCPDRIYNLEDVLCFARHVSGQEVTAESYKEYLDNKSYRS